MEIKARGRYLKTAPRKTKLVVDLIRNKKAIEAMALLKFSRKSAAKDVADVLKNAITIAKEREIREEDMYVAQATCDMGPRLKRGYASARGRYSPFQRIMSHVTIVIKEKAQTNKKLEEKRA